MCLKQLCPFHDRTRSKMGLSLTVHHLDLGVFILFYLLCMFCSHMCFKLLVGLSQFLHRSSVCHSISVRLHFCPQTHLCPLTAVPNSVTTTSPTLPPLHATCAIFIREFSANKVDFFNLNSFILRALGRKCFSFSLWESVGFKLSTSTKTSWCHGRLTLLS